IFRTPQCLVDGAPMLGNLLQGARRGQRSGFQSADHPVYLGQTRLDRHNSVADGAELLRDDLRLRTGRHVPRQQSTPPPSPIPLSSRVAPCDSAFARRSSASAWDAFNRSSALPAVSTSSSTT